MGFEFLSLQILCFAALVSASDTHDYEYSNQLNAISTDVDTSGSDFPSSYDVSGHPQQQLLFTKRFFVHSAPEEEGIDIQHRDIVVGTPRKNLNVVFVKAPIGKQQLTKVRVLPAIKEDKTVVYVLTKKSEPGKVETYVEEPVTTTSRPEVFFIKYKTKEEAEAAQQAIQAEYDNLGGSSSVSDEGISPVASVIGSLDDVHQEMLGTEYSSHVEVTHTINESDDPAEEYLPTGSEE